jgi:hypothetical protein
VKRILLGALAIGLLGVSAPQAMASGGFSYAGGCTFSANNQDTVTQPNTYVGALGARVVSTTDGPPPAPTGATVTCELKVNGNNVDVLVVTGSGVEVGAKATTYVAAPGDVVSLCTTVAYTNGTSANTDTSCGNSINVQVPPQPVIDLLDAVFTTLDGLEIALIDPIICPLLGGDLVLPDPIGVVWDCPPYL